MIVLALIFSFLDWTIYRIAAAAFRIICDVAETNFFTTTQIADVARRIYLILGVLILFEVVISAVQYLVNPDSFEDKEKGFGGLLKKTVITIALIVLVPVVFDFALSIQSTIIKSIPNIILGNKVVEFENKDKIGEELSFTVLSSFIKAKPGKGGSVGSTTTGGKAEGEIHDLDSFLAHAHQGCGLTSASCKYEYMLIISTLAGGFLCYILLSMALDVAVRTIKLGLIQMLSPIPISTYIFGKDKFNKFVKMSLQVYADLFIRMAIVYLIIFIFRSIIDNGILNVLAINGGDADFGSWIRHVITNILLIFGILMFAKSAPKFLTDLLGLPEITGGDMADMFKPAWQRVGGLAAPAAAIGAYRNSKEYGEKGFLRWRRAMSAGAHATVARLRDVASGKSLDESYKSSKEAAMARTNRNLEYRNRYPNRSDRRHQIWQERFDNYTGVTTGAKRTSSAINAAHTAMDIKSKAWTRANAKSLEARGKAWMNAAAYKDDASGQSITLSEALTLETDFAASPTATELTINGKTFKKQWLADHMQDIKDHASRAYIANTFENVNSGGDGETINTVRNKVLEILRSGADGDTLSKIFTHTVKDRNADGSEVIDPATGKAATVTYNLKELYDKIDAGINLSSKEAWAMSDIIQTINKNAGNVEAEALKRQTTAPKDS